MIGTLIECAARLGSPGIARTFAECYSPASGRNKRLARASARRGGGTALALELENERRLGRERPAGFSLRTHGAGGLGGATPMGDILPTFWQDCIASRQRKRTCRHFRGGRPPLDAREIKELSPTANHTCALPG